MSISAAIRPSRAMVCYLTGVHCVVFLVLFIVLSGLLQQLLMAAVVLCSLAYTYWRYATECSCRWVSQITLQDQSWFLFTSSGRHSVCLQQATVWRWLLIMDFYCEWEDCHYQVHLLPDSCDKEQQRCLRAIVRHFPVWQ